MGYDKKGVKVKQKYQNQCCHKYLECGKNTRVYCKCYKVIFECSGCFSDQNFERIKKLNAVIAKLGLGPVKFECEIPKKL